MEKLSANQSFVAENVVLDGRLALFHRTERWLAVADLHFGYELSHRAAGHLLPLWGMASVEQRLMELIEVYQPERLLILGDLVHGQASAAPASELLQRLRTYCEVIVIAGNHDRHAAGAIEFVASWETAAFYFHHGHCISEGRDRIQIIGHHHPAASIADGAGLRLKFPAFVQQARCWILPAFSPWASGVCWSNASGDQVWLCTPKRILRLTREDAAA